MASLKTVYGDSVISADGKLLDKFAQAAGMLAEVGDAGGTIIDIIPARQCFKLIPFPLPKKLTEYFQCVTFQPGFHLGFRVLELNVMLFKSEIY